MKIKVPDHVRFLMPSSRELQWAAMSIAQKWLNNYDTRMEAQDTSGGRALFDLHYEFTMPDEDFRIFEAVGLSLAKQPEKVFGPVDMIIDFREERIERLNDGLRHATQACGVMCGEDAKAVPKVRLVNPGVNAPWVTTHEGLAVALGARYVEAEAFYTVQNGDFRGMVGYAGWETYMAASMYLPVVEIVPATRSRNWLSKFCNLGYRPVRAGEKEIEETQRAMRSVEAMLCSLAQAETASRLTKMEASMSTAGTAVSL